MGQSQLYFYGLHAATGDADLDPRVPFLWESNTTRYPTSCIPQLVWHAFTLDFLSFDATSEQQDKYVLAGQRMMSLFNVSATREMMELASHYAHTDDYQLARQSPHRIGSANLALDAVALAVGIPATSSQGLGEWDAHRLTKMATSLPIHEKHAARNGSMVAARALQEHIESALFDFYDLGDSGSPITEVCPGVLQDEICEFYSSVLPVAFDAVTASCQGTRK